jgi:uncharacterized protein YkwD
MIFAASMHFALSNSKAAMIHRRFRSIVPVALCALALVVASCSDDDPVSPQPWEHAGIEDRVLTLVNDYRASKGLARLESDDVIRRVARGHSTNMMQGVTPFGHDGFSDRVAEIQKSITTLGAAENVAYNAGYADPAQAAFDGWIASAGHKANIEGSYTKTGIGVDRRSDGRFFLTQIFIRHN